jgi:hypothetical protein
MKHKKKIKALGKRIKELEKIISKDSVTLRDDNSPNQEVVIGFKSGLFSINKITTEATQTVDKIINEENQ